MVFGNSSSVGVLSSLVAQPRNPQVAAGSFLEMAHQLTLKASAVKREMKQGDMRARVACLADVGKKLVADVDGGAELHQKWQDLHNALDKTKGLPLSFEPPVLKNLEKIFGFFAKFIVENPEGDVKIAVSIMRKMVASGLDFEKYAKQVDLCWEGFCLGEMLEKIRSVKSDDGTWRTDGLDDLPRTVLAQLMRVGKLMEEGKDFFDLFAWGKELTTEGTTLMGSVGSSVAAAQLADINEKQTALMKVAACSAELTWTNGFKGDLEDWGQLEGFAKDFFESMDAKAVSLKISELQKVGRGSNPLFSVELEGRPTARVFLCHESGVMSGPKAAWHFRYIPRGKVFGTVSHMVG